MASLFTITVLHFAPDSFFDSDGIRFGLYPTVITWREVTTRKQKNESSHVIFTTVTEVNVIYLPWQQKTLLV